MRKSTRAIAIAAILFSALALIGCYNRIVVVPLPTPNDESTGGGITIPDLSGDETKGEVFSDNYTNDTTPIYDPIYESGINHDIAKNMIIENGVMKLYGGGGFISFDNDSTNNPPLDSIPGYNHSYTYDTTKNTYTIAIEGKFTQAFTPDSIDCLAGFFFAIRTPDSTYLTDGGFGFKNSSNSFDITYPGGGSVLASDIPSADVTGKDFRFTFTVSRAGDTISAASRLILGDKEYSYVKNANTANDVTCLYATFYGPHGANSAEYGSKYAELTSVTLSQTAVSAASDLANPSAVPAGTEAVDQFADDFSSDSTAFYDPTLISDTLPSSVVANLVYNPETREAELYGGGFQIQWDNDSKNDPEGVNPADYAYTFDTTKYAYRVNFSGTIAKDIDLNQIDSTFGPRVAGRGTNGSNFSWTGGIRFKVVDGELNLYAMPNSTDFESIDPLTALETDIQPGTAFEMRSTLYTTTQSGEDDFGTRLRTEYRLGNESSWKTVDTKLARPGTTDSSLNYIFLTMTGPYSRTNGSIDYQGTGPMFMTMKGVSLECLPLESSSFSD